jgi:catalase-peroxidase
MMVGGDFIPKNGNIFECYDYNTGELKWSATKVDLLIGHHPELKEMKTGTY